MSVRHALEQLDEIHDQLARSEVCRGFRVPAVSLVGMIGVVAAFAQPHAAVAVGGFVPYWVAVAGLGGAVGSAAGFRAYLADEDEFARRRTRRVLIQFLPCVLVGGVVPAVVGRLGPEFVACLPGLWAMTFGLGVVATSPFLPPNLALVGWGYVLAGAALLLAATPGETPAGWCVGGVFGAGHFATALALKNAAGDSHA